MKKRRFSFALSVMLALMLVFTMIPQSASALTPVPGGDIGVKVYVNYQMDDSGFMLAKQPVIVHPGLAADYGYSYGSNVTPADITALDVLVAAHAVVYDNLKDEVNKNLTVSDGFVGLSFGAAGPITFVDGAMPHTAAGDATFFDSYSGVNSYTGDSVPQAVIQGSDSVEFFVIQDPMWMDNVAWFEKDGAKVEALTAAPGEKIDLTVKGYMNWYGLAVPEDLAKKTVAIEDAALTAVDVSESGGVRSGEFSDYDSPLGISDAAGKLSLNAPTAPGTYYYSVFDKGGDAPLFSPWLEVTVSERAGWESESGGTWKYYENGAAVTGWKQIGGSWYHFASGGAMHSGWQNINNKWYYFGGANDGAMKSGWQKIKGSWYYLSGADSGVMKTGWQKIGSSWYYLSGANSGIMKTGWQLLGGKYYYFGGANDGVMKTGWQTISGKTYHFGSANDGKMRVGRVNISGKYYQFNASGALVSQTVAQTGTQTGRYVASRNSNVFHISSCRYVNQIKQANLIRFSSRNAATSSGHRPCKVCNP
jgi:hypothetical protein